MAYNIIRPRHGIKSLWDNYKSRVYKTGEMLVESPEEGVGSGPVNIKFGDGVTSYENLPYAVLAPTDNPGSVPNPLSAKGAAELREYLITLINKTATQERSNILNSASNYTDQKVTQEINNLVNGAPAALDTLKEISDALQGNATTVGTILNMISDLEEEVYSTQGSVVAENLIPYPYVTTNKTLNGITWTVNNDGTITVNGTATAVSYFFLDASSLLSAGTYTISGCPSGGGSGKYFIRVRDYTDEGNVTTITNDYGDGGTFTLTKDTPKRIYISIEKGVTVNNLTFKPMLEKGTVAHPYQPYSKSRDGIIEQIVVDNLIPFPYNEMVKTQGGVTWSVDKDGVIRGSGVGSADSGVYLARNFTLPVGTYTLSGCPKGGNANTYRIQLATLGYTINLNDFGDSITFTLTEETTFAYFTVLAKAGVDTSNLVFKPMLERGTVAHPYNPYRYGVKRVCERVESLLDNLLPYPYYETTKTSNGVVCTDNRDGSITFSGTASADVTFLCSNRLDNTDAFKLSAGTYVLTGCPKNGSDGTYKITVGKTQDGAYKVIAVDYGDGATFTLTEDTILQISPVIKKGQTVNNLVFKPVIRNVMSNPVLREDLDTLMEDTGWITLKETGDYTVEGSVTQYTVVRPIQYRAVGKQLFVRGYINISFSSNEEEYADVYIYLPEGFSTTGVTPRKLVQIDINADGTVGNTLEMSLDGSSIYFNAHRGIDGAWSIKKDFYESVLLD